MKYTRLGKTGLKVSRICLGCITYGDPARGTHLWALNEEEGRPFIKRALELGITYYDTANIYSLGASEEILGRAIRDFARREDVVIATKLYQRMRPDPNGRGTSRKAVMNEIDASLKRLGMDYVDLYQIHRWDDETPIEETVEAMHDVVKAGKARYIGASSMWAWQFSKALHVAERNGWTKFVSMQNHYNLLQRDEEREMMPLCRDEGIGVVPWSPLARGRLTRAAGDASTKRAGMDPSQDKYYGDTSPDSWQVKVIDQVGKIAAKRNVPRASIALAWLLAQPAVAAPIIGATKLSHLDDAAASVDIDLTSDELKQLELPFPGPAVYF